MEKVNSIFEKNQVVNEQLRLLVEKLPAKESGYAEAVRIGVITVSRDLLDLNTALDKERNEHKKQIERLKNKIEKLENQLKQ